MIETKDLVLDKAKFSDWEKMLENVWSHPESAKYMMWNITTNEEDAKIRIEKTIEFQKTHDTYFVYEKKSGDPIGFAGVEKISEEVWEEAGICLGPNYVHRGYGKQILQALIEYCKQQYNAKEFIYSSREQNEASIRLAKSLGFEQFDSDVKIDKRDTQEYKLLKFRLKL